jgi:U2 small nuclear ribonucleoprotein B''
MSVEAPSLPSDAMQGVAPTLAADTVPDGAGTSEPADGVPAEPEAAPEPEQAASETLYIQNLNERIKVPGKSSLLSSAAAAAYLLCDGRKADFKPRTVMKQTLRALFKNYGDVLDVVAHANLRMRGQAFISFPDAELAEKARREVNAFPLYGKPMVRVLLGRSS